MHNSEYSPPKKTRKQTLQSLTLCGYPRGVSSYKPHKGWKNKNSRKPHLGAEHPTFPSYTKAHGVLRLKHHRFSITKAQV